MSSRGWILLVTAALGWTIVRVGSAGPVRDATTWHTLSVSLSPAALASAAGLPRTPASADLLLDLIRVLHHSPLPSRRAGTVATVVDLVREVARSNTVEGPRYAVPSPLRRDTWRNAIFNRDQSDDELLAAIFEDRGAALLYFGMASVDGRTREALEVRPSLLSTIYARHASTFAAFGRSVVIRDGELVTPGPPELARDIWMWLARAPGPSVDVFLPALLSRDRGRLMFFFDTIARLDDERLRWVFGDDAHLAAERIQALYERFLSMNPEWNAEQYPFYRLSPDPSELLCAVQVDAAGRMAGDATRAFWSGVFAGTPARSPQDEPAQEDADPGWLLWHVFQHGPKDVVLRVRQVQFAQRRLAEVAPADAQLRLPIAEAAVRFARFPALMLGLEGAGVRTPAVYVEAARMAESLNARRTGGGAEITIFQSLLAIIDRAVMSRAIAASAGERLVRSLLEASSKSIPALPRWITSVLLPALSADLGCTSQTSAEELVLRALAGARALKTTAVAPIIECHGERFVVDEPVALFERYRELRADQQTPSLDSVLSAPADKELAAGVADSLRGLAYLPAVGAPEGPIRLAPDLPRRHVLARPGDDSAAAEWRVPREIVTPDRGWHVEGALIGLDAALGRLALRRLDVDLVPEEPRLDDDRRQRFVAHAGLLEADALDQHAAESVAAAFMRGRSRLAHLLEAPDDLDVIATDLSMASGRVEALRWELARGGADGLVTRFAPGELVRLGTPGPLPFDLVTVPREPCPRASASCRPQLTDLDVRLVIELVKMRLPVSLLPWMRPAATQDFIEQVQPSHPADDVALWSWIDTLPADRMDDYLAALEGNGPLRHVEGDRQELRP